MTDSLFTVIQSLDAIMIRVITASINKYCPRLTKTALTFTVWGRVPYICTNTAEKIYRSCQERVTLTLHLPLSSGRGLLCTHTHTVCVCVLICYTPAEPARLRLKRVHMDRKEEKNTRIPNFMKIRSVGAELFLRTDGHNEANSLFSQFCGSA